MLRHISTRFIPQHKASHTPLNRAAGLQRHLTALKRQVNDLESAQASSVSALHGAGPNTTLSGTWRCVSDARQTLPESRLQAPQVSHHQSAGWYRKDKGQSESMDTACELVKLPWIYRHFTPLSNCNALSAQRMSGLWYLHTL